MTTKPNKPVEIHSLNIFQRMHAIMADISYIQKGDKKVNGQYRFVSHDQVSSAVQVALIEHRVFCVPTIVDWKQDGNRTVAIVDVAYVNIDNPEDRTTVRAFGYGIDAQDKGPGKAMSYACKYAHLKAFCLSTGDDPDSSVKNSYVPEKIGEIRAKQLEKIFSDNPGYRENVMAILKSQYKTSNILDMPIEMYNKIVAHAYKQKPKVADKVEAPTNYQELVF